MCPNQRVNRNILPDCRIPNREVLYELLDYMYAEDVRIEAVGTQLRERYEIFRQVLHNYLMPIDARPDVSSIYHFAYHPQNQQRERRRQLLEAQSIASIENNASIYGVMSHTLSLTNSCDYYDGMVRRALAQLRDNCGAVQDRNEENQKQDSSDEGN